MSTDIRRLSQAPLVHVVAQIDFSELPAYDEAGLEHLHRRLVDAGFPERVEAGLEEVEWTLAVPEGQEPRQRKRQIPRWVFKGQGQRRLVELRRDCLLLKVTDYDGHEAFLAEWNEVMRLVAEALPDVDKALLHRLSLRYVDLVVPKEDEALKQLVSEALLPPPLPDVRGNPLFGSTTKVLDTDEGCHLRVMFEEIQPYQQRLTKVLPDDLTERDLDCGLSISAQPHWQTVSQAYGLLDIDHVYTASETPAVGDVDKPAMFQRLHEQTHRVFWGLITEQAAQPVVVRAAEIVARAKRVTGLSMKDLAPIFGVTRQTLYNFRKAQEKISERNWRRLEAVNRELEGLTEILPSSPGSLAKHFVFEGETLHSLLCAPSLDTPRIQRLAKALAKQLSSARQAEVRHAETVDQLTRHG